MAFKALKIIAILTVAALIPISAMAGGRTLCDFFGEEEGNFQVTYDLRRVNPGDMIFQNPEGGIKFDLAIALYETEAERDAFFKKIKRVVLYNMTTGDRYILKSGQTYKYWPWWAGYDFFSGEYSLHIGSPGLLLGNWKVIVYGERWVPYKAYFTLTQEMLEQKAPIPVEASVSGDGNGGYHVTCDYTGAHEYRLRVFDDEDVSWEANMICHIFQPDPENPDDPTSYDPTNSFCEAEVPSQYEGYRARIEARIFSQKWPRLMEWGEPDTCEPNGMIPGRGFARSITWFDISVPEPE